MAQCGGLNQNKFGDILNGNYAHIDPCTGILRFYGSARPIFGDLDSGNYAEFDTETGNLTFYGTAKAKFRSFIIDPTAGEPVASEQGEVYWEQDSETASIIQNGAVLQVGQEFQYYCQNNTGVDIADGVPVMLAGTVGASGRILITPMDGTDPANARYFLGVTTETIPDGETGKVTSAGKVRGIDTSMWDEGDILHVSPTVVGGFVTTTPEKPLINMPFAVVITKHDKVGSLGVRVIPIDLNRIGGKYGHVIDGNYSEFEADGTLKFYGDATQWEDLNFSPDRAGGPVVNVPDYVTINNVIHREFTSANNQLCGDVQEVPHSYKLGTTMVPHMHVFLKSGESEGTTGVTFTFYWELRESTGTTSGSATLSATSAQLLANAHKVNIYDATGFTGPSELEAQLAVTIARTAGDAGDIVPTTFGVHYEKDMVGSHTAITK